MHVSGKPSNVDTDLFNDPITIVFYITFSNPQTLRFYFNVIHYACGIWKLKAELWKKLKKLSFNVIYY